MSRLISILLLLSSIANAADYLVITKTDGSVVEGELIGTYEAKWFWENASRNTYKALFFIEESKPKIIFINKADILKESLSSQDKSSYNNFIKENKIYFEASPIRSWSQISTGNEDHHLNENMWGNFAWDFVKIQNESQFKNQGSTNGDYFVWSEPLHSPVSGTIVALVNDEVDNQPDPSFSSDLSKKNDGNYVLIHIRDNFYLSLLHLKQNSIPKTFTIGDKINVGDFLGLIGNSGISYVPHLHMTMLYWSAELNRMVSVPSFFSNLKVKNGPRSTPYTSCEFKPTKGQSIATHQSRDKHCSFKCQSVLLK